MADVFPWLRVSWPWNPNHRYRLYMMDAASTFRRMMTVRSSNKDASIYLTPLYEREYSVQSADGNISLGHRPGADFHLSLHETGVVNLTTSEGQVRLRGPLSVDKDPLHVATLQINSLESFPEASLEEINRPKGQHLKIPMFGFPGCPMMLSVYVVRDVTTWNMPILGNAFMIDYETTLTNGQYVFHFIQWQQLGMPPGRGDVALQFFPNEGINAQ